MGKDDGRESGKEKAGWRHSGEESGKKEVGKRERKEWRRHSRERGVEGKRQKTCININTDDSFNGPFGQSIRFFGKTGGDQNRVP